MSIKTEDLYKTREGRYNNNLVYKNIILPKEETEAENRELQIAKQNIQKSANEKTIKPVENNQINNPVNNLLDSYAKYCNQSLQVANSSNMSKNDIEYTANSQTENVDITAQLDRIENMLNDIYYSSQSIYKSIYDYLQNLIPTTNDK